MMFLLMSLSLAVFLTVSSIEHDINSHQLRLSVRDLQFATSCEYTIGQMEVLNLVRRVSVWFLFFCRV